MSEVKDEFGALVAQAMESTIVGAVKQLSRDYQETTLEATEHLQAIIIGNVTKAAEYASLYDYALVTPKLYRDLTSDKRHTEVARSWGQTEQAVRRAREKVLDNGIQLQRKRLQSVQLHSARRDGSDRDTPLRGGQT